METNQKFIDRIAISSRAYYNLILTNVHGIFKFQQHAKLKQE